MEYDGTYCFYPAGRCGVCMGPRLGKRMAGGVFGATVRGGLFCLFCGNPPEIAGRYFTWKIWYDLNMENTIILQLIGFVVCFILLFVFTAKYRAALAAEEDNETETEDLTVKTVSQRPSFESRGTLLNSLQGTASLEVADLQEKVKELQYRLEEMQISNNKSASDVAKQLSRLEARISTFEQEYVTKLQPTLLSLIQELENIKVAESKSEK